MRDLARQNLNIRAGRKKVNPRAVKIFLIVAGLVVVILFVNSGLNIPVVGGGGVVLREARSGLTPVEVSSGPISVEGGIDLTSNKATLRSAGGISGSGSAERIFGAGSFTMTVNATFVGIGGHKYQVWLTDGDAVADAGFLEGTGNNWSTTFRDTDKGYSKMNEIWITDEITTEDNKPEKKILVGGF